MIYIGDELDNKDFWETSLADGTRKSMKDSLWTEIGNKIDGEVWISVNIRVLRKIENKLYARLLGDDV